MSYAVDWTGPALATLATAWMSVATPDRNSVTVAQAKIDSLLGVDPISNGSLLSEGLYSIAVRPLRVLYEVSENNHLVTVVAANLFS
jgi:hypothetical protein